MGTPLEELERDRRARARVAWLVVLAVVAGAGAWLTAPFGVVLLTRGEPLGWVLVASGALLLAGCAASIVAAVRLRIAPQSRPGKANPAFDEPAPSQHPDGGYSTAGMKLGSP
jgi:NO-binding membrane sensor protein with MHYT domain